MVITVKINIESQIVKVNALALAVPPNLFFTNFSILIFPHKKLSQNQILHLLLDKLMLLNKKYKHSNLNLCCSLTQNYKKQDLLKGMEIHDCCAQVKVLEFKKHLVAALGHLGCFNVSVDCNSNLLKCPVNDLPSPSKQRNSMFML